ncbi:MAG: hypothetical protein WC390_07175 [Sulfurimonas sp.]
MKIITIKNKKYKLVEQEPDDCGNCDIFEITNCQQVKEYECGWGYVWKEISEGEIINENLDKQQG